MTIASLLDLSVVAVLKTVAKTTIIEPSDSSKIPLDLQIRIFHSLRTIFLQKGKKVFNKKTFKFLFGNNPTHFTDQHWKIQPVWLSWVHPKNLKIAILSLKVFQAPNFSSWIAKANFLEKLEVTDSISIKTLKTIADHCVRLTHLKLSLPASIQSEGLSYLRKKCTRLSSIILRRSTYGRCSSIGNKEIKALLLKGAPCHTLSLQPCWDLSSRGVGLLHLHGKTLKVLKIRYFPLVQEKDFAHLLKELPQLQHLKIGGFTFSGDSLISSKNKMIDNKVKKLTLLQIELSKTVSDRFVAALIKDNPDLIACHFWQCDKLSTLTTQAAFTLCERLRFYYFSRCSPKLTTKAFRKPKCFLLEYLLIMNCTILGGGVTSFLQQMKKLAHLELWKMGVPPDNIKESLTSLTSLRNLVLASGSWLDEKKIHFPLLESVCMGAQMTPTLAAALLDKSPKLRHFECIVTNEGNSLTYFFRDNYQKYPNVYFRINFSDCHGIEYNWSVRQKRGKFSFCMDPEKYIKNLIPEIGVNYNTKRMA